MLKLRLMLTSMSMLTETLTSTSLTNSIFREIFLLDTINNVHNVQESNGTLQEVEESEIVNNEDSSMIGFLSTFTEHSDSQFANIPKKMAVLINNCIQSLVNLLIKL